MRLHADQRRREAHCEVALGVLVGSVGLVRGTDCEPSAITRLEISCLQYDMGRMRACVQVRVVLEFGCDLVISACLLLYHVSLYNGALVWR
jgi:hypothetical protein